MIQLATKFAPTSPQPFEVAWRSGFRNAELWLGPELLDNWQQVVGYARQHPLRYSLHFPNRGPISSQMLSNVTELYGALDCETLVIHQPMLRGFGKALQEVEPSIRLAVENHRFRPEEFQSWARDHDWLTLDVEHLWKYTLADGPLVELLETLRNFLARYSDKIAQVHLPGYLPGFAEHRPMYCSREMVMEVFSLLAQCDFTGMIVSEVALEYQNGSELKMDLLLFDRWRETQSTPSASGWSAPVLGDTTKLVPARSGAC